MRADKETICLSIQKKSIDRGRGRDGEIPLSSQCCVRALSLWGNLPVLVNFASAISVHE